MSIDWERSKEVTLPSVDSVFAAVGALLEKVVTAVVVTGTIVVVVGVVVVALVVDVLVVDVVLAVGVVVVVLVDVIVVVGVVVVLVVVEVGVVAEVPTMTVPLLIVGLRALALASANPESLPRVIASTQLLLTALKMIVTKVPVPFGPPLPPSNVWARFVFEPVVLLTVEVLLKREP
jgi:hypothetical protein